MTFPAASRRLPVLATVALVALLAGAVFTQPVGAPAGAPTFAAPVSVGFDAEPGVTVAPGGSPIYVAGASNIWKSTNGGTNWTEVTPSQVIAGDANVAIGSTGALYYQSLWVGSSWSWTSFNQGASWPIQNAFSTNPYADRNWIAAHGPNTVYAKADLFASPVQTPLLYKSTDGGQTFLPTTSTIDGLSTTSGAFKGAITVDPNNGNVYIPADATTPSTASGGFNVVTSTNGGANLIASPVPTPHGPSYSVILNVATDSAGNAYVAWISQDGNAWTLQYSYSTNSGASWSNPVKVVTGGGASRVFPWIVANGTGGLDIAYYETTGSTATPDAVPGGTSWNVRMTQVTGATTATPVVTTVTVASGVHAGPICTLGVTCASGTRVLLDFLGIGLDPNSGNAYVVYTADPGVVKFAKQNGGTTI